MVHQNGLRLGRIYFDIDDEMETVFLCIENAFIELFKLSHCLLIFCEIGDRKGD